MAYCAVHRASFADDEDCPHCASPEGLEDDDFFDCHMGRSGVCGKAGSEECEFECPYRADQRKEQTK